MQSSQQCKNFEARFCCPKIIQDKSAQSISRRSLFDNDPELPGSYEEIKFKKIRNESINTESFNITNKLFCLSKIIDDWLS